MPSPVQNPTLSDSLVSSLGLKGRFGLAVDEILVPVVQTDQLQLSPFQEAKPVGRQLGDAAAGVGRFSVVGVSPGPDVLLYVMQVYIQNDTGAAQSVVLSFLDAADVAALANLETFQMFSYNRTRVTVPEVGSTIFRGDNAAANPGDQFLSIRVQTDETYRITLPRGLTASGRDPSGTPAIACVAQTANQALRVSYYCIEYPPKG